MPETWELIEEARKTVMSINMWLDTIGCDKAYRKDMKETYKKTKPELEKQAEISFKAGYQAAVSKYQSYLQQGDRREALINIIKKSPCWNRCETNIPSSINEYLEQLANRILSLFPAPVAPEKLSLISREEQLGCSALSKYPFKEVADVIEEACKHQQDSDATQIEEANQKWKQYEKTILEHEELIEEAKSIARQEALIEAGEICRQRVEEARKEGIKEVVNCLQTKFEKHPGNPL